MKNRTLITLFTFAFAILAAGSAFAFPPLQIYIEGATFDEASETWVTEGTGSLRLWAVANTGRYGPILDVKLSIAYATGLTPTFGLEGSTTMGYNGFDDPSEASDPTFHQTVTDGSVPLFGDGDPLPSHGIYGAGTSWTEYKLGNFDQEDSHITDFNGTTDSPSPHANKMGQINVYDITVGDVPEGTALHFDLYDHYVSQNGAEMYVKAPFSHDGETTAVPEPGTLALVGVGVAGLAARLRKRTAK